MIEISLRNKGLPRSLFAKANFSVGLRGWENPDSPGMTTSVGSSSFFYLAIVVYSYTCNKYIHDFAALTRQIPSVITWITP